MGSVALKFTYRIDIICVPDDVAGQIKKHQRAFDKWIYDKRNDHGHWIYENGRKFAVCFDTSTFVEYLNQFPLRNRTEKAFIEREDVPELPHGMPNLFF